MTTKDNEYITIVQTYNFYVTEKQYHLDAISDIDDLLKELSFTNPDAYTNYDTGGCGDAILLTEDE